MFFDLNEQDSVSYTIYAENIYGCRDTANYNLSILPNPQIQVSQDLVVLSGTQIQMTAFSPNNVNFIWSPDSLLSCNNCTNPNTQIIESTDFYVSAADQYSCDAIDTISVVVYESCAEEFLKFPNIFTPNNDGQNDVFVPYRLQNLVPPIKYFRIFDRWGELIYETDDVTNGWDGTRNGNKMNNGVYVYALEIECFAGSKEVKRGNVTLIR